ncbi:hypothetical protein ROLI_025940 [Roseobacter fucihabitans]|uniref:Uncharacterized protein n=1 Tax=Roseobacter fucihabitans TaxID=1537242 RepID=A0ABZ2BTV3_9RHOB|nr:hypothetical protein [Roseobacter litoralis]
MSKIYSTASLALEGVLEPDMIHLPGIYVHRIVQGTHEKRIEQRTTRARAPAAAYAA